MKLEFTITPQHSGKTVYTILRREMQFSAALVRRLKQTGGIFLNGEPVYTNHIVTEGDICSADLGLAEPPCDNIPEDGPIEVLFENAGFVAVNKPAGVLVHPSHAKNSGTLANFVAGYLEKTIGDPRCHAVNRLDRDTSGVVLFAKNSHFKALASTALHSEGTVKQYTAIVLGVLPRCSGTIDLPIRREAEGNMRRIIAPDGQRAITHYEVLGTANILGAEISAVRFRLMTGRTHQIRVHCLAAGHPILGDRLYCSPHSGELSARLDINAQLLHAETLTFTDPISKEQVTVSAPVRREDMERLLKMF